MNRILFCVLYSCIRLILTFSEGVKMLRDAGVEVGDYDDLRFLIYNQC